MPYEIKKLSDNYYEVINKKTKKVHAKHTTLEKAKAQIRLMEMVDSKNQKRK